MFLNMMKQQPVGIFYKLDNLKKAERLNLSMQRLLQEEKTKIIKLLAVNSVKLDTLENIIKEMELKTELEKGRDSRRVAALFAAPYFRDEKKMVAPPTEDALTKRKNCDVNAFLTIPRPWTDAEKKTLLDGVTEFALFSAMKPLIKERDHLNNKMQSKNIPMEEMEDLEDDFYIVEQKIRLTKRKSPSELMDQLNENIDWMTVSATFMQGCRTPEECEIMWNNYLSFDINKETFSEDEDNKLVDLAEEYNERNWDAVAASLKAFEKVKLFWC